MFAVSGRAFQWADVVCAAKAWGRWAECGRAAREGRSALLTAAVSGTPIAGAEFDAEEERFRRSRGLLAADDLVSWLGGRGVEVSAWREYIRGVVLRRGGPSQNASPAVDDQAVWVHAACSGALDSVASRLAARAAVAGALDRLGDSGEPLTECELADWDRLFAEFCERSATADAIEREVDRHRLDWVQLEWRSQATADHDVVREAALCISDDGLDFEQAAAAAGLAVQRLRTDLDGVAEELRPHLLGARIGELLGPLSVGSEYWLIEVLDKRVPSSDDPEVRALARDAVVSRAVEAEVVDRVRWNERV